MEFIIIFAFKKLRCNEKKKKVSMDNVCRFSKETETNYMLGRISLDKFEEEGNKTVACG